MLKSCYRSIRFMHLFTLQYKSYINIEGKLIVFFFFFLGTSFSSKLVWGYLTPTNYVIIKDIIHM